MWEQDKEAVDEAQEALDDFILEQKINAIQEEINNWNDYIEKVEESSEIYAQEQRKQLLEMEYGRDYGAQILQDMEDNLGKTVENSVGLLQDLIDQWNNLYAAQSQIANMPTTEIISGLDTGVSNTSGGATYNKNVDYMAIINSIKREIARQDAEIGTHTSDLDRLVEYYTDLRNQKIEGENLNQDGTPKTEGSSSSSGGSSGGGSSSSSSSSSSSFKPGGIVGGIASTIGSVISGVVNAIKGSSSSSKKNSSSSSKSSSGRKAADKASNFSEGGIVDYTGSANVHGSSSRSEVVFNSTDAKKLYDLVHNNDLKSIESDVLNKLSSIMNDINKDSNNGTNIEIGNINLPSVKNGNDFIRQLKVISLNR